MSTAAMPIHVHTRIDGSLGLDTKESVSYVTPLPEDFRALLALNLLTAFAAAFPITFLPKTFGVSYAVETSAEGVLQLEHSSNPGLGEELPDGRYGYLPNHPLCYD
jgi:hypothetical protein